MTPNEIPPHPDSLYHFRRWVLGLCIASLAVAFYLTHVPAARLPCVPASDKTLHTIGFFILSSVFLISLSAYNAPKKGRLRRAALVLLVMAVYAAFDETTQPLVNRTCSGWDWLADITGTIIAVSIWGLAWLVRRKSPAE